MTRARLDVFLQPGEHWFGDRHTRIRTLLGSCVAVTLWHPLHRVGGMCHFLLPKRTASGLPCDPQCPAALCPVRDAPGGCRRRGHRDGRYGDEAIALLVEAIEAHGTRVSQYEAKVFGGGDMFGARRAAGRSLVGEQNVGAALALLERHGVPMKASHFGDRGYRNVFFDIATGHVWMRHVARPVAA